MAPPSTRPLRLALCLVLAGVALGGCGEEPGSEGSGGGEIAITLTRDFGGTAVATLPRQPLPAAPALGGLIERFGQPRPRTSLFVNGIAADDPPAKLTAHGGDRVWLDQHARTIAPRIPAVIGSFPEPFVHGIGGKRLPVRVECDEPRSGPCAAVAEKLVSLGVVAGRSIISRSAADDTLRVLVGPWKRLRARDVEADRIDAGPRASGVFARFNSAGDRLVVLDTRGRPARTLGAGTGFIAATREPERRPVWFVTGTDDAGVTSAARAFDESVLSDRFALAISRDLPVAVPLPGPQG